MRNLLFLFVLLILASSLNAQKMPQLIEKSLQQFDIPNPYSGDNTPKIRLGIYSSELNLKVPFTLDKKTNIDKMYKVWHMIPHWPAWEAGIYPGDTLLLIDGKPIYNEEHRGDNFLCVYLWDKSPGDDVTLTILKNGKPKEIDVELFTVNIQDTPFSDPGLGSIRKNTWLQRTIMEYKLQDWVEEIQNQMTVVANSDYNKVPFSDRHSPWRLNAVTYLHNNPFRTAAYSRLIVDDIWNGFIPDKTTRAGEIKFTNTNIGLAGVVQNMAKHLDIPFVDYPLPQLPTDLNSIGNYLSRINAELDIAYKNIKSDKNKLKQSLMNVIRIGNDLQKKNNQSEQEFRQLILEKEKELASVFAECDKIDFFALTAAGQYAAALANPTWIDHITSMLQKELDYMIYSGEVTPIGDGVYLYQASRYCMIIGDGSNSRILGNADIIIDLGGDDYYNLTELEPGKCRIIIDASGNDVYTSSSQGQGAGVFGIEILCDMKGNDTYRSKEFSQGAGMMGIGVLADFAGDDIYRAESVSQGAGYLGIGLLYDLEGNDNYISEVFSQGFGYIKGIGAILELKGNDSYRAGWKYPDSRDPERAHLSMSQGFGYGLRPWTMGVGADGGIGIISDLNGHDVYNADFFSQGGSYWYALGILHDRNGCDRYTAGQYSQGSGIHLSHGALLDDSGNDMYDAYAGLEQGNAHDWSSGCLEDMGGDDTYRGYTSSQGSALTVSFAWLFDAEGNDMYIINPADSSLSQGGGRYEPIRNIGSLGILLDIGKGQDYFTDKSVVKGFPVVKGNKGIIYDDGEK